MAVKIKLKRMGKIREPYYRIVVADARTKRDGRAIEEIGKYHPKSDPSFIEVNSERAQHWLSVGAQPTDPVRKLLEVTGDWQRFKGLPGAEGTLMTAAPRSDKKEIFAAALAETLAEAPAGPKGKGRAGGRSADAKARDAKAGDAKAADANAGATTRRRRPRRSRRPPRLATMPLPPVPVTLRRRRASPPSRSPPRPSQAAETEVLIEALEHLVRGIVDFPDDVHVSSRSLRRGRVLQVRVHPEDLGKVIGRGGRTARALRTVIGSLAGDSYVRVDLLDADEAR